MKVDHLIEAVLNGEDPKLLIESSESVEFAILVNDVSTRGWIRELLKQYKVPFVYKVKGKAGQSQYIGSVDEIQYRGLVRAIEKYNKRYENRDYETENGVKLIVDVPEEWKKSQKRSRQARSANDINERTKHLFDTLPIEDCLLNGEKQSEMEWFSWVYDQLLMMAGDETHLTDTDADGWYKAVMNFEVDNAIVRGYFDVNNETGEYIGPSPMEAYQKQEEEQLEVALRGENTNVLLEDSGEFKYTSVAQLDSRDYGELLYHIDFDDIAEKYYNPREDLLLVTRVADDIPIGWIQERLYKNRLRHYYIPKDFNGRELKRRVQTRDAAASIISRNFDLNPRYFDI